MRSSKPQVYGKKIDIPNVRCVLVEIAPFRGLTYNRSEIQQHGGLLVAPPYDVLNDAEREDCLNLNPHNILHLDLGPRDEGDQDKYAWHQRSADLLKQWMDEGVLERLDKPAIFHIETTCRNPLKGGSIVRHGFVCLMKLEDFIEDPENSQVRPHEKTFSSHKEERLSLMKHTKANLSQVFGFFPDEDRSALKLMTAAAKAKEPDMDIKDYRGFQHRVWIDEREESNQALVSCLSVRKVYIADGHHRYETALNYRRWLKETMGDKAPASADYVMMYLCPMSDPGLVILPTHRLLNQERFSKDEMLQRLSAYFKISGKCFTEENEPIIRDRFLWKMKKQKDCLGVYMSGRPTYYTLKLTDAGRADAALSGEPKELAALDTVILSNLIFKEALGLTEEDLDNPDIISYVSNLGKALEMIREGQHSAAFLLNPATVEDILRVTEKGYIMPRKSTFFYPKVTTGLVLNLID
ncbi:hypothetical protein C4J81_10665 [Deltaproteobacteria bacterium Smac51]|nr:hypothetical protein C4J81_10665 [Deltaproteobacteria bacterium Smac51]